MITYDRLYEIIAANDGTTRGDLADAIWAEIGPPKRESKPDVVSVACGTCTAFLGWVARGSDQQDVNNLMHKHDCPGSEASDLKSVAG